MEVKLLTDETVAEPEVTVRCGAVTPEVERLLAMLNMLNRHLAVRKEGAYYNLSLDQIIYMESVDRKTFVYTPEEIYESSLRLYELEEQLEGFFRVSKSFLINLQKIQSLKADINRRIRVTMQNGEQIMASRQYADALKKRLGVK